MRLADRFPSAVSTSPKLDYYKNAESWKPSAETTLADLIEAIRKGDFADAVTEVRAFVEAGETDKANERKKLLPAVSLSGSITGRRKKAVEEGRFEHSGFLQIDLDAKDHPDWSLEALRAALLGDPRICAVFLSPSGNGLKGVARCLPDTARHKESFLAAEAHFRTLGLKIDPACKDPVRLCFVSSDPDAWMGAEDGPRFAPMPEPQLTNRDVEPLDDAPDIAPTVAPLPGKSGGLVIRGRAPYDAATIREMLRTIPYPGYGEWLKITNAVWREIGIAEGTPLLQEWAPEKNPGDYEKHAKYPLQDVTIATVVMRAKDAGWKPSAKARAFLQEIAETKKIDVVTAGVEPDDEKSTMQQFRPEDVFYDAPGSKYLVKIGNAFFTFGKAGPVRTGITRHLAPKYKNPTELNVAVAATLQNRELDGAVQWTGNIAGMRQGLAKDPNGLPILITSEAKPPEPCEGEAGDGAALIMDLLAQAFGTEPVAAQVFIAWLAGRYKALREHVHVPSPMLVLAGEVNCGKSLLAWIVSQMLGGRTANPYSAWSGGSLWNDDLVGSELLLVDDCSASTDIRARRNFGAAFKEAIYPHFVQLRKRNVSAVSVRPVWACMVCCNDTPEALQIIPPLDADMSDKVILLHVSKITPPVDTSLPSNRPVLQEMLRREFPVFARQLLDEPVPDELKDSRSGVIAWRDPQLIDSVDAQSPARRLEDILRTAIEHRGIWHDLPREFLASEIEARLLDHQSPVRDLARGLFTWHGACGSALSRLVKMGSEVVEQGSQDTHRKVSRYFLKP